MSKRYVHFHEALTRVSDALAAIGLAAAVQEEVLAKLALGELKARAGRRELGFWRIKGSELDYDVPALFWAVWRHAPLGKSWGEVVVWRSADGNFFEGIGKIEIEQSGLDSFLAQIAGRGAVEKQSERRNPGPTPLADWATVDSLVLQKLSVRANPQNKPGVGEVENLIVVALAEIGNTSTIADDTIRNRAKAIRRKFLKLHDPVGNEPNHNLG